jgi:hypothetical protein
MYKAFSPTVLAEMEDRGNILITVKPGWEGGGDWISKPSYISYCIGTEREHIFTCYLSHESKAVQVSNMEATGLISDNKALVDAYMCIALKGLVVFAKSLNARRLLVDSFIPATADYMLDLGFYVTSKGLSAGARGCKTLRK